MPGALKAPLWRPVALGAAAFGAIWLLKNVARLKFIVRTFKERGVGLSILLPVVLMIMFFVYFLLPLALYGMGWLIGEIASGLSIGQVKA